CPARQQYEDWDFPRLQKAFSEQFDLRVAGLSEISNRQELARKLYQDAEAVLKKKEEELGTENFYRLFRELFLREIDRQWIEHLQAMDHLRDGIGLRGYGQRDPKKEYKREGFDMFLTMLHNMKSSVMFAMYRVERAREEDLARMEEERRQQAER